MSSQDLPLGTPVLEEAIDYQPLIVAPHVSLRETLSLMNQIQKTSCSLPNWEYFTKGKNQLAVKSSCVLVLEENKIQGIFTERDLVRLIASNQELDQVVIGEVMTHPVIRLKVENFKDVFAALFLFRRYRIRHLPIVDEEEQLIGVVSHESLRSCLRPSNLLKLRRVSDVMSSNVVKAPLTSSVLNLAKLMADHRVSCVVIMQEIYERGYVPVGIVTERDILQFQVLEMNLAKITAEQVMSSPLFLLNPDDSLWFAHQQMQKMMVRRLVVSYNWEESLGIVTQTSLLRVFDPMEMYGVINTLQNTVEKLKKGRDDNLLKDKITKDSTKFQSQNSIFSLNSHNQIFTLDLEILLSNLEDKLSTLINEPLMEPEKKEQILNSGIADIKRIRKLIE